MLCDDGEVYNRSLDELYQQFGFYQYELNTHIVLDGAEGQSKLLVWQTYSTDPPSSIDGTDVVKVQDFNKRRSSMKKETVFRRQDDHAYSAEETFRNRPSGRT